MTLEVKVDTKRLERVFATCPQDLDRVMPGQTARIGQRYLGFFAARRLRGPPGVRGTRNGIRKQFSVDVTGSKFDNLRVSVFSTSPVLRIHEFGGTTVGRRGDLTVPFSSLSKAEK